ncbi:hypothetical protein Tco_1355178 [Tanacetum coccineum]
MYGFKECSSCGALYNREHCCSNVSSVDNFVRDPNSPLQPQTSSFNQHRCFHCKDPLEEDEHCKQCTCKRCGSGLSKGFCFICASSNENSSIDNPNPNSFNDPPNVFSQPPQHQYETYSCEFCGGNSHPGFDCQKGNTPIFDQGPCYNQDFGFNQPSHYSPSQPQTYSCELCGNDAHYGYDCPPHVPETPKVLLLAWDKYFEIKHACKENQHQQEDIQELLRKLLNDVQILSEELADYINTPNWNRPAFYNNDDEDDDEEYTIAITPVLPTVEPDNSLSMGEEHLSTIPEKEDMCDVPFCDNSTPLEASKDHYEILLDSNNDYSLSDDDSLYTDDIDYIYTSPPDSELVSLEEIEALKDNPTPSSDFVTKSPSTSPNSFLEETNIFYNSLPESEIFYFNLEEKSSGNPTSYTNLSLPDYEAFFCDSEPDLGDFTMDMVEDIFDNPTREPRVYVPNVFFPSLNHFMLIIPIRDIQPLMWEDIPVDVPNLDSDFTLFMIDTLLLFSFENEDKVVNPDILAAGEEISPHLLSHQGFKAFQLIFESLMLIYEGDIPNLDVLITPNYEASHARGFVIRSLELRILSFIMGIQYPKSYRLTFIFEHT